MRRQTQWAAQFAVASELCKRGYEVAFTMGNNTPLADLTVVSPEKKKMFLIDVKGLYRKNYWLLKSKDARADLFYVLTHVPTGSANEFFVMTQSEINEAIRADFKKRPEGTNKDKYSGFLWTVAVPHRDKWNKLPK